ncbi:MAG: primosomal protein N' [Planctomycetota bacterium]
MAYAEIVFPIPLDKRFHYKIPEPLSGLLKIGARVEVDFGPRTTIGYCVGLVDSLPAASAGYNIRDIKRIIDETPLLNDKMFELCRWVSEYYFCSLGQAFDAALPSGVRQIPKTLITRKSKNKDPFLSDEVTLVEPYTPNQAQAKALETILPVLESDASRVFLLYGITGSGKTEVYLQSINRALELGKQSIVLVPEIALTPQAILRFRQRFSTDKIAVLHSHLTNKERAGHWKRIQSGQAKIVIGARSAIFAPFSNLGLVVIDEEHETTYKQQNAPMYHAREAAIRRAKAENAHVILGSATPSLESYHKAMSGEYTLIKLPERIEQRPLPTVDIVDMSKEMDPRNPMPILSKKLEVLLRHAVREGNQVILFLNRRGFVTMVTCPRCRFIIRCKRCAVGLTYHKQTAKGHEDKLFCHYCGKEYDMPSVCPECGHPKLRNIGTGTEKVEEHIKKIFVVRLPVKLQPTIPGSNFTNCRSTVPDFTKGVPTEEPVPTVSRMDSDIMRSRQSYHQALCDLATGETDIMVGTQMIAKGLDLPNVTLVGIISGDTMLYIKDFRSPERTFQLITQVAGRSGRGPKGGKVVVQTFNPEHYSIQTAAKHDFEEFARKELVYRKELNYPPFSQLLRILVEGRDEKVIENVAGEISRRIESTLGPEVEILGPAPAPLGRIRSRFRWHVIIKAKDFNPLKLAVDSVKGIIAGYGKSILVTFDHDPISLL